MAQSEVLGLQQQLAEAKATNERLSAIIKQQQATISHLQVHSSPPHGIKPSLMLHAALTMCQPSHNRCTTCGRFLDCTHDVSAGKLVNPCRVTMKPGRHNSAAPTP